MHATGLKTLAAFVGLSLSAILLGAQRRTASITSSQPDDRSADSLAQHDVATGLNQQLASTETARQRQASSPRDRGETQLKSPAVVLFSTRPAGTTTQVMLTSDSAAPTTIAEIDHVPEAIVRGAVVPGSHGASFTVVAVADRIPGHRSWPSSLFKIENAKVVELANHVATGSRPIVNDAGHAFVVRGREGAEPRGAEMRQRLRIDAIEIVEVDLSAGTTHTLLSTEAYGALVVGWDKARGELITDIATPHGGKLVAINTSTLSQRIIVDHWPLGAREFSLDTDGDRLVVQQRDATSITVEHVELGSGKRIVIERGNTRDLAPFALPSGRLLMTHGDDAKPDRESKIVGGPMLDLPTLQGTLWVRAMSSDQRWISALGLRHRAPPVPLLVDIVSGKGRVLQAPENTWIEIAGFVDERSDSHGEVVR